MAKSATVKQIIRDAEGSIVGMVEEHETSPPVDVAEVARVAGQAAADRIADLQTRLEAEGARMSESATRQVSQAQREMQKIGEAALRVAVSAQHEAASAIERERLAHFDVAVLREAGSEAGAERHAAATRSGIIAGWTLAQQLAGQHGLTLPDLDPADVARVVASVKAPGAT